MAPTRFLAFAAALLLAACASAPPTPAAEEPVEIAVTYDDLPVIDDNGDLAWAQSVTSDLLSGLQRHRIVSTGFVNERQLEGPDGPARVRLLESWLDAGMGLANHGYSHLSLTTTPIAQYEADVARGATQTRALLAERGRTLRYFRHPFLHTGPTKEIRQRFDAWLATNGYTVAPVTVENSDWMFASVYSDAVRSKDAAGVKRIRDAYLAYSDAKFGWYKQAAEAVLGRQPRHILLLHVNRLNADTVDEMARLLDRHGFTPISLERALEDPAYKTPDPYVGPDGVGWLHRWGMALGKQLPWSTDPKVPADISADFARLSKGG